VVTGTTGVTLVLTDNVMPWGEVVPAWDCWYDSGFQGNSHTVMLGEHCECRSYTCGDYFTDTE